MICFLLPLYVHAQNPVSEVVEGGKALVELIKIFRSPKAGQQAQQQPAPVVTDSCAILQRSNLCFLNNTNKSIMVSIFKRNGDAYAAQPFTNKVLPQNEECWFELKASIYKYRIEIDNGISRSVLREGEFRLEACENMQREITE